MRGLLGRGLCAAIAAAGLASCSDATAPVVPTPTTLAVAVGSISFPALGRTQQITVTVRDQRGDPMSGVALSWTSSAPSVATVSTTGLVTAVGNGAATITVAAGAASVPVAVTVQQVAATLALSAAQTSFGALGDTLRLTATVRDADGSVIAGALVAWASTDTLVATVTAAGLVTARANGTTTIVVISASALATASLTVAQVPSAIALSASGLSFVVLRDTTQLTATVSDARGAGFQGAGVSWSSSDTLVAKVSASGLVTAIGNGTASITATAGLATRSVPVSVQQVPASIQVQQDSVVLGAPGETVTLTATAFDAAGFAIPNASIAWTSSDTMIVRVNGSGLLTAVATGTVTISANSGGPTAQVSARVVPQLTLVAAGPTSASAQVNSQVTLSVRVRDLLGAGYQGATVTWSAGVGSGSIPSGTQAPSGPGGYAAAVWLLGTGAGTQQATASIVSRGIVINVAFTATALAGPAVTAVLVADSVLLSARGETAYLSPTYRDVFLNSTSPSGATWTSRSPTVATVASDGLVTGQSAGATYVVASMPSSTDSILVTVVMRGGITVTFDDGFITAYTNAWPVFQEFGLPGNIGVNPAQVGFPAYMTKANLDGLHAAGWSIVSHSMTHDTLPTLSVAELDYELRASKQWIDAQGYNGSNVFLVPFHMWGARERDAIGTYYEAARGTFANTQTPDSLVAWRPSNPYALTGIDAEALPYTTVQGRDRLRALLQRTVDEGVFLDVFLHHLPAGNVQAFRDMLTVINDFRERVLPYHALYPRSARAVF